MKIDVTQEHIEAAHYAPYGDTPDETEVRLRMHPVALALQDHLKSPLVASVDDDILSSRVEVANTKGRVCWSHEISAWGRTSDENDLKPFSFDANLPFKYRRIPEVSFRVTRKHLLMAGDRDMHPAAYCMAERLQPGYTVQVWEQCCVFFFEELEVYRVWSPLVLIGMTDEWNFISGVRDDPEDSTGDCQIFQPFTFRLAVPAEYLK